MDVDTRLLRAFVTVADERHVTRAAQRLHIAQPALSKQLRRLEDQLGTRLLVRSRHGVELTATGSALLPAARDAVAAWDSAQRRVRTAGRTELPKLSVGFIASAANELTPEIARRFASLRPGWRLELVQSDWSDPTAGLADATTDAALLRLPIPDSAELCIEPLFSEPRCVAMPSHHHLADRERLTMRDLLDEPFVTTRGPAQWRDWWLGTEARGGRTALVGAVVGTPDEWTQAILGGFGVSLSFASAARYYAVPGITYRPISGLSPSTVGVAHRHDARNAAVEDFVLATRQAVAAGETTPFAPDAASTP